MNYNGYIISVTKQSNGAPDAQYLAKALNSSDYAFGNSEDHAISVLKGKLDAIPAFHDMYMRPYESDKLDRFIAKLKDPRTLAQLRIRFDRKHYIEQDFCDIDARAMVNHFDVIEQVLKEDGNDYKLDCLKISPHDEKEYFLLFDKHHFDTEVKILSLINGLEN